MSRSKTALTLAVLASAAAFLLSLGSSSSHERGSRDATNTRFLAPPPGTADSDISGTHTPQTDVLDTLFSARRPGDIEIEVRDVHTRRPVADLEIEIDLGSESNRVHTDEQGKIALTGIAPAHFSARATGPGYRGWIAGLPIDLGDRVTPPLRLWVERWTTLRLRFAHADGSSCGRVLVVGRSLDPARRDSRLSETCRPRGFVDFRTRPGTRVELQAVSQDGYRATLDFACEEWPLDEREVWLAPIRAVGRARIRVAVVEQQTLKPIPGAWVRYGQVFSLDGRSGFRFGSTRTDEAGIAVLENVPTHGRIDVAAWSKSWCYAGRQVDVQPRADLSLTLALEPGFSIRGTYPTQPEARITLRVGKETYRRHDDDWPPGSFLFRHLRRGLHTVVATHAITGAVLNSSNVEAGSAPIRIEFSPTGRLLFHCQDPAGRVPSEIEIHLQRPGAARPQVFRVPRQDANYSLPGLLPGPARVSLKAPGYRKTEPRAIHVTADATRELTVSLAYPLPVLEAFVCDPSGSPVPNVEVLVVPIKGPGSDIEGFFDSNFAGRVKFDETNRLSAATKADGWAVFPRDIAEPTEFEVAVETLDSDVLIGTDRLARPFPSRPYRKLVRLSTTGSVRVAFVVRPRPFVWQHGESLPPGLRDRDLLVEWNGWPLSVTAEVPKRWSAPATVKVQRHGKQFTVTLPAMSRTFGVRQDVLPVR